MDMNNLPSGTRATFKGFSSLEEGFVPSLQPGLTVEIIRKGADGDYVCVAVDGEGNRLNLEGQPFVEGDALMADSVWPEELENPVLPEVSESDAEEAVAAAQVEAAEAGDAAPDFSTMEREELDDFASRNGVVTPSNWAKMNVQKRRDFLASWLVNQGGDAAEGAQGEDQGTRLPVDSDSVRDLLSEKDAVEAALELVKKSDDVAYQLGGVLTHIDETGVYKRLGYQGKKGFEDFVREHLGIEYRKARYLISIYTMFKRLGVPESDLHRIGWPKAKELIRVGYEALTTDVNTLLDYAATHTRDELSAHIKQNYEVATRAVTQRVTTFTFKVAEENAAIITAALEHAKTMTGEDDINRALVHICGDWQQAAAGSDLDLETYARLGLSRFGREELLALLSQMDGADENAQQAQVA